MSSLKRNVFLSVFGAAMTATAAFAADLPAPPVIEYEPEVPIEIGSGWYLRGDVGFAVYQGGDASWTPYGEAKRVFKHNDFENGWVAGGGFGYYFNEHFRADVTADYRSKIKYDGKAPCTAICTTDEHAKFSAWTLMLNGYYDFGTWSSFTPYVGAGVGVASLRVSDYASDPAGTFRFGSNRETNFAYNLMAGAVFDVSPNIKIDANYRFTSLGEAQTGGVVGYPEHGPVKYEDLYAHDFRVGLRYDLN